MTLKDSTAITRANELLNDPDATPEDLRDAKAGVTDEIRALNATAAPEPGMATSLEEMQRLERETQDRQKLGGVLENLHRRLTDAINRADAQRAIDTADSKRAELLSKLEQAEEIHRQAQAANAEMMEAAKRIEADKNAAGRKGQGIVGAEPEIVERIIGLGVFDGEHGAPLARFRRQVAIGQE